MSVFGEEYPPAGMTDQETAAHLRQWVAEGHHSIFSWPTDACGHDQHIRFVLHRNKHWFGGHGQFEAFVLAYADMLDPQPAAP